MYRDQRFFTPNGQPTHVYDVGDNKNKSPLGGHYASVVPASPSVGIPLAGTVYGIPNPLGEFKFQPQEICPQNFIIFDQTNHTNQVMFNPALVQDFGTQNIENFDAHAVEAHKSVGRGNDNEDRYETSIGEDTEDIDALLSSETEEEDDDVDDEVVSTGRTPGNNSRVSSTNSCYSLQGLKFCRASISSRKSISNNSGSTKSEKDSMNGLVQALRNIIPGGNELDASMFLDEAVKYLKAVKVEMEDLGVHSFDEY